MNRDKYLETLFTILKGRLPTQKEFDFFKTRYELSILPEINQVQTVSGTAVDNTDPYNPIINVIGTDAGSEVTLAQFTQLNNTVNLHINNKNNPHVTKGDNIPEGADLITIFNTGLI